MFKLRFNFLWSVLVMFPINWMISFWHVSCGSPLNFYKSKLKLFTINHFSHGSQYQWIAKHQQCIAGERGGLERSRELSAWLPLERLAKYSLLLSLHWSHFQVCWGGCKSCGEMQAFLQPIIQTTAGAQGRREGTCGWFIRPFLTLWGQPER